MNIAQESMRYCTGQTPVGRVIVVAGSSGIRAVALGDSDDELVADQLMQHPDVTRDESLREIVLSIATLIESPGSCLDAPLDIRGTPFQVSVWNALRQIPIGTVITYGELARRLGAPSAVRAVARACGANTLAVAIPCHRVVGRDGSLTGYRWGIERKRELLAREMGEGKGRMVNGEW